MEYEKAKSYEDRIIYAILGLVLTAGVISLYNTRTETKLVKPNKLEIKIDETQDKTFMSGLNK